MLRLSLGCRIRGTIGVVVFKNPHSSIHTAHSRPSTPHRYRTPSILNPQPIPFTFHPEPGTNAEHLQPSTLDPCRTPSNPDPQSSTHNPQHVNINPQHTTRRGAASLHRKPANPTTPIKAPFSQLFAALLSELGGVRHGLGKPLVSSHHGPLQTYESCLETLKLSHLGIVEASRRGESPAIRLSPVLGRR